MTTRTPFPNPLPLPNKKIQACRTCYYSYVSTGNKQKKTVNWWKLFTWVSSLHVMSIHVLSILPVIPAAFLGEKFPFMWSAVILALELTGRPGPIPAASVLPGLLPKLSSDPLFEDTGIATGNWWKLSAVVVDCCWKLHESTNIETTTSAVPC